MGVLIFNGPGTESIEVLIFRCPGIASIDFDWSGDTKYLFLVVLLGQKVLICSGLRKKKSLGSSFEPGRTPRARAPRRQRVLWRSVQRALERSRTLCSGSK